MQTVLDLKFTFKNFIIIHSGITTQRIDELIELGYITINPPGRNYGTLSFSKYYKDNNNGELDLLIMAWAAWKILLRKDWWLADFIEDVPHNLSSNPIRFILPYKIGIA